ncbi:unnamed protein product [Boreogadus saida]
MAPPRAVGAARGLAIPWPPISNDQSPGRGGHGWAGRPAPLPPGARAPRSGREEGGLVEELRIPARLRGDKRRTYQSESRSSCVRQGAFTTSGQRKSCGCEPRCLQPDLRGVQRPVAPLAAP